MQKIGTEGTKVTTISIDADTLAILDQAQAAWDCSRSEEIRRIVADHAKLDAYAEDALFYYLRLAK